MFIRRYDRIDGKRESVANSTVPEAPMPPDFKMNIYSATEVLEKIPNLRERFVHALAKYAVISEMLPQHATSCEGPETASSLNIRVSGAITAREFPDIDELCGGIFCERASEMVGAQMYAGEALAHKAVLLFQLPIGCWIFRNPRNGEVRPTEFHKDSNHVAENHYPWGGGPLIISRNKEVSSREEIRSGGFISYTPRPNDVAFSTLQEYPHGAADISMNERDARSLVREGLMLDDAVADQLPLGEILSPDVEIGRLLAGGGARFTYAVNRYEQGGEEKRDVLDPRFSLDDHLAGIRRADN